MKRNLLIKLIFAFAAIALTVSHFAFGSTGINLLTAPFLLAAKGLRQLSLSGTTGNAVAIAVFLLLGLVPLLLKLKKPWHREDLLLLFVTMTIWYALYYLINPGIRAGVLMGSTGEMILCGCVYSVFLCWGILKLLKTYNRENTAAVYRALEIFLLLCAGERALAVVTRFYGFLSTVETVQAANTMPGLDLLPTHLFAFFAFGVSALEYALNAFTLSLGADLAAKLCRDPYSEECAGASEKAARWCRRSLVLITAGHMALNLSQVLFASRLHSLSAQFHFPVSSLAVVFALLVLSSLLGKARQLKEDNDLFI